MKKTSLIFLIAIIIFAVFTVFSLLNKKPTSSTSTIVTSVTPSISNTCIITINNQKYDVTQFKNQHSGGDIFNCGTDMTTIFNGKHSQRELNMMQQYLVK